MNDDAESGLRAAVAETYRQLGRQGLNQGSTGNVSCRIADNLLITPSGRHWDSVTAESIVKMDFGGLCQGLEIPSSEWEMHLEIYRRRPEAMAIIHTHSDACVALSCLRRPIPAFHYMIAGFGGDDVPCAPYAPFGSRELALSAASCLVERTACLLANHGAVCHGETLSSALVAAVSVEALARQYILALQVGQPVVLTNMEMSETRERFQLYCNRSLKDCK